VGIEFGLLGPLAVVRDGDPVLGLSAKQRQLLALLLVHPNSVVTVDALVDGLWPMVRPRRR
jgi:DNA-binding SARP family transcriptional activator